MRFRRNRGLRGSDNFLGTSFHRSPESKAPGGSDQVRLPPKTRNQLWADARKVPQIAFRPDFTRHKNAAPFERNDQLLAVQPIGVAVFPDSGISDNLADKARALGIPLFDFRKGIGA
jgi:hypothetical protein